mmetsp:Transcript_16136/g.50475  ORF Transcript_16136/g.50475 Transcript_16136/m.50475 type:complete len:219 (-) Transcript_16136:3417-4073(-)
MDAPCRRLRDAGRRNGSSRSAWRPLGDLREAVRLLADEVVESPLYVDPRREVAELATQLPVSESNQARWRVGRGASPALVPERTLFTRRLLASRLAATTVGPSSHSCNCSGVGRATSEDRAREGVSVGASPSASSISSMFRRMRSSSSSSRCDSWLRPLGDCGRRDAIPLDDFRDRGRLRLPPSPGSHPGTRRRWADPVVVALGSSTFRIAFECMPVS